MARSKLTVRLSTGGRVDRSQLATANPRESFAERAAADLASREATPVAAVAVSASGKGLKRKRKPCSKVAEARKAKRRQAMKRIKQERNREAQELMPLLHAYFNSDGSVLGLGAGIPRPHLFTEMSSKALYRCAAVFTQLTVETSKLAKAASQKKKAHRAAVLAHYSGSSDESEDETLGEYY